MADFIVLRLIPATPVDATTFTNYLSGLTINVYYVVKFYSAGVAPTPDQYQGLSASNVSVYVTVPPTSDSNLAQLQLPTDGSLPNYDDLLAAINKVLAADPGPAGQDLIALTAAS